MNFKLLVTFISFLCTTICYSTQQLSDADQADVIVWKNECRQIKMTQPMIMVEVYIINDKNELLLGKYEGLDLWSVPMTWMQQQDASLIECAQRAVLQETGIVAHDLELYHINDTGLHGIVKNNELQEPERVIIAFYTTHNFSGEPQPLQFDHTDWLHCYTNYESWQWFSKENLPANIDSFCLTDTQLSEIFEQRTAS